MRDRLIDILLEDCVTFTDEYKVSARLQAERVADILLANGVIVPPCKVGDKVWCIEENDNGDFCIAKRFVTAILISGIGMKIRCGFCLYKPQEVGKELFFNEADAEKALKEREGKG